MIKIINEVNFDKWEEENNFGDIDEEWVVHLPKECIKGATLLNETEYYECKYNIPPFRDDYWWLIPDNNLHGSICYVDEYGDVCNSFYGIDTYNCIRPVLILSPQSYSINLNDGDKFEFGEHFFTIISNNLAICDNIIGTGCFRGDEKAPDATVYEKSDVKKVVDNWFNKAYSEYEE